MQGTQFVYPNDWLPPLAVATGFNLAAGASTIVKAKWPRANVPVEGTHSCLLASAYTAVDQPINGHHVWEHNNLAQKNLTVVNLLPDDVYTLDFQVGSLFSSQAKNLLLEISRPYAMPEAAVKIVPKNTAIIKRLLERLKQSSFTLNNKVQHQSSVRFLQPTRIVVNGININAHALTKLYPMYDGELDSRQKFSIGIYQSFGGVQELSSSGIKAIKLRKGQVARLGLTVLPRETQKLAMEIRVPKNTRIGTKLRYDRIAA